MIAKTTSLAPLSPSQVLIRVLSSSVNPIDVKTRTGIGFVAKNKQAGVFLPLGYDVYGIIERVGDAIVKSICGKYATGMVGFAKRPSSYSEFVIAEC